MGWKYGFRTKEGTAMKRSKVGKKNDPQSKTPEADAVARHPYFEHSLKYSGKTPSAATTATLIAAVNEFAQRKSPDDFSALESYLVKHKQSPWRASLLLNIGACYLRAGRFSKALAAFEQSWTLSRSEDTPDMVEVANRAYAEAVLMNARLGRRARLEKLLPQFKGREATGPATEFISSAWWGYYLMKTKPGDSFKCGALALNAVLKTRSSSIKQREVLLHAQSTPTGMSLDLVRTLAAKIKLDLVPAKRLKGADVVVPSIVHWKADHYAAITEERDGRYKVSDETFGVGFEIWITKDAIDEEGSGYFLVPPGKIGQGWSAVSKREAASVTGKGMPTAFDKDRTTENDPKVRPDNCSPGMAHYNVHASLVSLNISDLPLRYPSPRLGSIDFKLTYNQREVNQPSLDQVFNVGSKWSFNWRSMLADTGDDSSTVTWIVEGGGAVRFGGYDPNTRQFGRDSSSGTMLTRRNRVADEFHYTIDMPDGSRRIYRTRLVRADGTRLFFLNTIVDPTGRNNIHLHYDEEHRLTELHEGVTWIQRADDSSMVTSRVTRFHYEFGDVRISKIVDPYGRTATLQYDDARRLTRITDALGVTSIVRYAGASDFIRELETPYRKVRFTSNEYIQKGDGSLVPIPSDPGQLSGDLVRMVRNFHAEQTAPTAIPLEKVQFVHHHTPANNPLDISYEVAPSEPNPDYPRPSYYSSRDELKGGNVYYWDKKAIHDHNIHAEPEASASDPNNADYDHAKVFHFLYLEMHSRFSGVLHSVKSPRHELVEDGRTITGQNRVWYHYKNQAGPEVLGPSTLVTSVSRLLAHDDETLDDPAPQTFLFDYDDLHRLTTTIDPHRRPTGRTVKRQYNAAGRLETISRMIGPGGLFNDVLSVTYDSRFPGGFFPSEVYHTNGYKSSCQYNEYGQITQYINQRNATYKYIYDADGFLSKVVLPSSAAIYVTYGQIGGKKIARIDGISVEFNYTGPRTAVAYAIEAYSYGYADASGNPDAFDRVRKISFRDGSNIQIRYDKLVIDSIIDRMGRTTSFTHDEHLRVIGVTDPEENTASYEWCYCGKLQKIVNPAGNAVEMTYDSSGRLLTKAYKEGNATTVRQERFAYYPGTSLLRKHFPSGLADAGTKFEYFADGKLKKISTYAAGQTRATHSRSFEYSDFFDRIDKLTDTRDGSVEFAYYDLPSMIGPGRTPLPGAGLLKTLRTTCPDVNLSANNSFIDVTNHIVYDELNRVTQSRTAGSVTVSGQGLGDDPVTVDVDTTRDFRYDPIGRLSQETNELGNFSYNYSDVFSNRLQSIVKDAGAFQSQFSYDLATYYLKSIIHSESGSEVGRQTYAAYNDAGLVTEWQKRAGDIPSDYTLVYDGVDRLAGYTKLRAGSIPFDERVSDTYDNSGNRIMRLVERITDTTEPVQSVTYNYDAVNQLRVEHSHSDLLNADRTRHYAWDPRGRTRTDGNRTYEWDALSRLRRIDYASGTKATFLNYDALGRLSSLTESNDGTIKHAAITNLASRRVFVWDGLSPAAEIILLNGQKPVVRYHYQQGFIDSGRPKRKYNYARDHLGSITDIVGEGNDRALHVDYDPWGNATTSGSVNSVHEPTFSFCGYMYHKPSGLYLTLFRQYDPAIGRWLSPDPLGESSGLNLYAYVNGNPVNATDPFGLTTASAGANFGVGLLAGALSTGAIMIAAAGVATIGPVAAAAVTGGLLIGGAISLVGVGIDIYVNYQDDNMDAVAFDVGALAGGLFVGGVAGRALAESISASESPAWSLASDWAQRFDSSMGGGGSWLGTGPNPASGAGSAAGAGAAGAAGKRCSE
jgi:RHS repeat-associated protein